MRPVDHTRRDESDEVARHHGLQSAERLDVDLSRSGLRGGDPRDHCQNHTTPRSSDGAVGRSVLPGEQKPERHHGRANRDAHEEIDPAEVELQLEEHHAQHAHAQAEDDDYVSGDAHDVLAVCRRLEIHLVDVVRKHRSHGHRLGRPSRDNGHEEHDRDHQSALGAVQVGGDGGGDEARARLVCGDGQLQSDGGDAACRGQSKGDGEPDHAAEEVALVRHRRLRSNRGLPVRLVHEDGAKVADDVDDAEHEARLGQHGQVRPARVARDAAAGEHGARQRFPVVVGEVVVVDVVARVRDAARLGGVQAVGQRKSAVAAAAAAKARVVALVRGRIDGLALEPGVVNRVRQHVVNIVGAKVFHVDGVDHDQQDQEDDARVDVRGKESRLQPASGGVEDDAPGD
mmetsp:Transcript_26656/g.89709  ORF Transcript_26656/g.89709 Transcript_26656/m.89709 type:complete len:400 (-) Transcript_26656:657-1856(-)